VTWRVRLTREAVDDLQRIGEFLFEQALQHGDLTLPLRAEAAIRRELALLQTNPFTCRKADGDPFERELVIPFGHSGFLALFRILGEGEVAVLALRHQREDDWH
jgi:plasmid stabilization system protein ParE